MRKILSISLNEEEAKDYQDVVEYFKVGPTQIFRSMIGVMKSQIPDLATIIHDKVLDTEE